MKKQNLIILYIFLILFGFILNGLAWAILPGPTLSTLGLLLGLALTLFGFVFLIITLSKK